MKSPTGILKEISRKANQIAYQLEDLELMPVSEVAKYWGTTKEYVRRNVPIVKLGPKTHRVRVTDAVEFQARRTQQP